jgi:hypothetical protein
MIQNPGCDFHAIWWVEREVSDHEKELWDHFCYQYYIWGHVVRTKEAFIQCIKDIERGTKYVRDQPFIKRSHEEPTILAKMLRQFPGISSEKAIALDSYLYNNGVQNFKDLFEWSGSLVAACNTVFGVKKDGSQKAITIKLIKWLETGESP